MLPGPSWIHGRGGQRGKEMEREDRKGVGWQGDVVVDGAGKQMYSAALKKKGEAVHNEL